MRAHILLRTGRLIAATAVGAAMLAAGGGTAAAHQDGCHRWHSCPSDTGSYVCGDLGYSSECPGYVPSGPSAGTVAAPAPIAPGDGSTFQLGRDLTESSGIQFQVQPSTGSSAPSIRISTSPARDTTGLLSGTVYPVYLSSVGGLYAGTLDGWLFAGPVPILGPGTYYWQSYLID